MSDRNDPHTVSIHLSKGGTGKTTVTVSMAAAIAAAGGRVLVVDLDHQRNATLLLEPQLPDEPLTVRDVHYNGTPGIAVEATYRSGWTALPEIGGRGGVLDVLPGDSQMSERDIEPDTIRNLSTALQGLGEQYDIVLLDCPPSTGFVVQAGVAASEKILFVAQPQHLAVVGLGQSLEFIEHLNADLPPGDPARAEVAGVVMNQYDGRRKEHRAALAEVVDAVGATCWTPPIPERAVIQNLAASHFPLPAASDAASRAVAAVFARHAAHLLRTFEDPVLMPLVLRMAGEDLTEDALVADGVELAGV